MKRKFWSILLLLFYLEGIYLPTLQQQTRLWQYAIFEISNIQLDSEAVRTKTVETRWNECKNVYISFTFLCLCPHCLAIKQNFNVSKKAY